MDLSRKPTINESFVLIQAKLERQKLENVLFYFQVVVNVLDDLGSDEELASIDEAF